MTLPAVYRKSGEGAIASFDYVDIAEGTGIVIFYITNFQTSAGITFGLVGRAQKSVTRFTNPPNATTTTYNMDLSLFNLPQVVKGTAYFSGKIEGVGGETLYLLVQLKKWDGTSETNITPEVQSATVSGAVDKRLYFKMECSQTSFKRGDILRLTVKTVAGTNTIMYHDPMNTSGADPTDTMRIDVPFRINL